MATITRASDREVEAMRRSALGANQGPTDEQQAGFPYPLARMRRIMGDPQDPTNVSFPFLHRMRRDHVVSMGLHFTEMPVVSAPWYFQCSDAQVAAYADHLIRPIYGDLVMLILRMLGFGYSPGAQNFDHVQPEWTYYVNGEAKKVWDNGAIDAIIIKEIVPLRPEDASLTWDASGSFNGIRYDERYGTVGGGFVIGGRTTPNVDKLHSIWATHDRISENGSPYGFPRIAHCAPIFWMYRYIWDLLARAFEDSADPGPLVRYPEEFNRVGDDGLPVNNAQTAIKLGTKRRSGSTVALPSTTYKDLMDKATSTYLWGIEYPKGDTDFGALMAFIGYLEASKFRALWLPDQGSIEGEKGSSSRNVASEYGDQRDASQRSLMTQVDDVIVGQVTMPVIRMVFPQFSGDLSKKTIGLGDDENDIVRQVFQLMGQQDYRRFGVDLRRLAESQGLPMLDPAEFQKEMDKAEQDAVANANSSQPPAVTPTQGRRSLVTQTGFGEMVYHQLGDELSLADVALDATDDGDFVSSLPATDAFEEPAIKLEARRIRARSQAFLAWAYRDFAIYVGKRKLDQSSAEDLADEEFLKLGPKQLAAKMVRAWLPRQQKVDDYTKGVSKSLGNVFSGTAARHSRNLGKRASIDDAAAAWLSDHGAQMVRQIMQTTREQLADALAEGVKQGKTPRQIAADITANFEGFPKSRASAIALTEVPRAYNYATVRAGEAAGVKRAQLIDGNYDESCRARNGKIVPLADAAKEDLNHPFCLFCVRLLPGAPANLSVRREALEHDLALYDEETSTILLDHRLSADDETKYMLALALAFE